MPHSKRFRVKGFGWLSLFLVLALWCSGTEGAEGFYSIHVSTFKGVRDTAREMARLQGRGCETFCRLEPVEGKGEMYRVYVGRYHTREEAKEASRAMKREGYVSYTLIRRFEDGESPPPRQGAEEAVATVEAEPTPPAGPPETDMPGLHHSPSAREETDPPPSAPEPPKEAQTAHDQAVGAENPAGGEKERGPGTPGADTLQDSGLARQSDPPAPGTRFFSIHVSTFKGVRDTTREMLRLQGHGCETFYRLESIEGKGEMYRVYVGRYRTREEAREASKAIKQEGYVSYTFIRRFEDGESPPPRQGAEEAAAAVEAEPTPPAGPPETDMPGLDHSASANGETDAPALGHSPPAKEETDAVSSPEAPRRIPVHGPEPAPVAVQDQPPEAVAPLPVPAPKSMAAPAGGIGGRGDELGQKSGRLLSVPLERRPRRETVRLSLLDAIRYSLAGNMEVEIASYEPRQAAEDVTRSNSVYDPLFFFEDRHSRGPNTNSTLDQILIEDSTLMRSGVRKPLTTGGSVSVFMEMEYFDTRNGLLDRNYRYTSSPTVELRQPLLKNLGGKAEKSAILIADHSLNISEENLRQTFIETVTRVSQAYWMLYLHHEFMKINRENLKMAEEVYRREVFRLDQGLSRELDVQRARAALEERRGNLLRSEERSRVTTDLLKNELNWSNLKIDSAAGIIPTERPKTLPEEVDESQAIQKALLNRPEIAKTREGMGIAAIREDLASHERLPNLDAFARYGRSGFGREFSLSFDEIDSGDRNEWVLGVSLEWPIGNRSANALHRRRILEKRQKAADAERIENQVKREVKEALHGIHLAKGEIDSTLSRVESAEKVVEGEFARFDLGQVTNEELLRAQDLLTSARRDFVRAVIDYNMALSELNRAQGIFMEGVEIDGTEASSPF